MWTEIDEFTNIWYFAPVTVVQSKNSVTVFKNNRFCFGSSYRTTDQAKDEFLRTCQRYHNHLFVNIGKMIKSDDPVTIMRLFEKLIEPQVG